jgi:hypothetical protein
MARRLYRLRCPAPRIGIFARHNGELKRARNAVKAAGALALELTDNIETTAGRIWIGTMHLAKGLDFVPSPLWPATTR